VGVEAEECNKIIRVQEVQVKEEMEEPKEAAVNKREGRGRVNAANLKGTYLCSDEGKRALKMSDDKGRKVSKGGILIRSLLGGVAYRWGKGQASSRSRRRHQIRDARTNNIVLYSKLTPPLILASNSH
jgi:hypothetical protein